MSDKTSNLWFLFCYFTDEKLKKMNKLLEILCNPNQRIPLETLLKCEVALEKMDFKMTFLPPSAGSASQPTTHREQSVGSI